MYMEKARLLCIWRRLGYCTYREARLLYIQRSQAIVHTEKPGYCTYREVRLLYVHRRLFVMPK